LMLLWGQGSWLANSLPDKPFPPSWKLLWMLDRRRYSSCYSHVNQTKDWAKRLEAGPYRVAPSQFRLGLSGMTKQKWGKPLVFPYRGKSVKIIANRRAWVVDKTGLPLVEQIGFGKGRSAFVNYLPWQYVLGRMEVADATFIARLEAMGKWKPKEATVPKPSKDGTASVIHFPPLDTSQYVLSCHQPGRRAPETKLRPVLAAADRGRKQGGGSASRPSVIQVIDVRGESTSGQVEQMLAGLQDEIKRLERIQKTFPSSATLSWIILGDDPALKQWEWLTSTEKLIDSFRGIPKKKRNDEVLQKGLRGLGVYWLEDDSLPSKWESQVKLMQLLTELGVLIKTTSVRQEGTSS
jgi:hypothetical protein